MNVPRVLAEIREQSYRQYAVPHWYGAPVALILTISIAALLFAAPGLTHASMTAIFGTTAIVVISLLAAGFLRFWKDLGKPKFLRLAALRDALTLKYLDKKDGRRWFHHLTFYGFLLCFAATSVAAIYHYLLGWEAPYAYFSLPVVLGTLGGIGLLIGTAGLYMVKRTGSSFMALLFLTSLTGLLLLGLRETSAARALLGIHLGTVLTLFITMPYGKFVHGIYRLGALVRYALETLPSLSLPLE